MRSTAFHRHAWPFSILAALLGGLVLAAVLGASAYAPSAAAAQAGDGRYSVLVFSRTTGFRHSTAIDAGHDAIQQMGVEGDFETIHSEDAGDFSDHNLRDIDVVVFLNTDGEGILNAAQRAAFERWMQRGGGLVSIHADANADRNWAWKTDMQGGALFLNHPSGAVQFQNADVHVEDGDHPATAHLPAVWTRQDEWYSFTANPRGDVHVLMTIDEDSYDLTGATPMGEDHPIAWCSLYDGGRHFYTALGHHGAYWAEPLYRDHIEGAIEWAAGEAEGDCGPERAGLPTEASLTKVAVEEDVANPMSLTVADDGRVFFVQMGSTQSVSGPAQVRMHDPEAGQTYTIGTLQVFRRNEIGLMGIALDPDFDSNNFIYLYYGRPGGQNTDMGANRLSRFTFDPAAGQAGQLDMSSEVVLLEVPNQRLVCCHESGSIQFGPDGLLYLSTGDNTEHARSGGYSPHDGRPCGPDSWNAGDANCNANPETWPLDARHANDARRSSGNTNDLRGKILRIDPIDSATPASTPGPGSTYEIPEGNLFPPGTERTRPEIYTMGHRNPFRFGFDPQTGWIYQGEVGPDAGNDSLAPPPSTGRGPRGYDEINQIRSAGNYGWPYCIGNNQAYRPFIWTGTGNSGAGVPGDNNPSWPDTGGTPVQDNSIPYFDCASGPTNHSPLNNGLEVVPPGRSAWIWYPYGASPEFPEIPAAGTRAAIGGPVYRFDPDLESDVKLSEWFDGRLIWGDWTRNLLMASDVAPDGSYAGSTRLMPNELFRHPHDIELGPDGAIYLIEWGLAFNYGSYGVNADAGVYRIEQRRGGLPALATASASPRSGGAPLNVQFTGELSDRGAGDRPTYEWDFGDGSEPSSEPNPTHTYTEVGTYQATLTVIDEAGETTDSVTITVREPGPICGPARSDDFEGTTLNLDRWQVVRHEESRLSVSDGALNIVSAPADIFNSDQGLPNIVTHELPEAGSEPWSITAELTWNPTQNFQNAGLMIYGDDDNYYKFGMVWSGSRQFEQWKELNGSAGESQFGGNVGGGFPQTFFMRLASADGTTFTAGYSPDGENWTNMNPRTITGIPNPKLALYATASTQGGVGQPTASFQSVTIEPDSVVECPETCGRSDEFDGAELNTERWGVRVDEPGEATIEGGRLVLPILNEIDGTATGPLAFVHQQVPDGDWSLTTRVTPELDRSWAQAGLMLWQSDGNFVKAVFGRTPEGARRFELTSDNPTDQRQIGPNVPVDGSFPDTAWIRLYREGNTIGAEFAPDVAGEPGAWQPFASTRPVNVNPPREGEGVLVGLYAGSDIEGPPFEQTAAFDFARFDPDDEDCPGEDTTPPETTHALDPAEPGAGGTYGGPVEVTLSATDPGDDGGAEPQEHDVQAVAATWDPEQLEAATGDVVTWHFDDPPAQFPHDVWLVPPGANPDPAAGELIAVSDGIVPAGGPPVSHTVGQAGTWTYVCRLHSGFAGGQWTGMVGTLEVSARPGDASGVAFTEYRVNTDGAAGEWQRADNTEGDDPFATAFTVSDEGEHVVEYRSTDNAGNVESVRSVEFEIAGPPKPEYCPRSDGFDDAELDMDRWTVIREDPDRLSVSESALRLVAPTLDIFTGSTGLPNIVVQPLPDGGEEAWSVTTEMTWSPTTNFQNAGLIVYEDDDNYVKTGMVWNGSRNFELIKELSGVASFPGGATSAASVGERFFLRFRSPDGSELHAEFSADGEDWTEIGTTGTNLDGLSDLHVGVYATASTAGGAQENTAIFHSVAIEPECAPDTTPPVTTVQLNGAVPASRYDRAVTATFTATDPGDDPSGVALTEFRVDSTAEDAWVAYDPLNPPVVTGNGAHTIHYRSTDAAGNVEDTRSVGFTIDATVTPPLGGGPSTPPPSGGGPSTPPPQAGSAVLKASVKPKRKSAGKKAGQVRFRLRVANTGDAATGALRLCVKVPKRKLQVIGARCRTVESLDAGRSVSRTFRLKLKSAVRGRQAKIRFTVNGQGVAKRRAVATLRARG